MLYLVKTVISVLITNNYAYNKLNNTYFRRTNNLSTRTHPQNTAFTGININAMSEKGLHGIEYSMRIIANRFADLFEGKKIKEITKMIAQIKPEANAQYLFQLELISRYFSTLKTIDVNIEDKIFEKIAQDGKSTIFIMNHSNQKQDPSMLAVLNTLLVKAYKDAGKEKEFPLPKIILNQDILKTMNKTKRKAFENFGAVGIDANIYNADKGFNARAFFPVIKDFVRNKANIFIFPEGKLAIRSDLDFDSRFQIGIAELIKKVLGIKKEVTVVPVGFSYGKGKNKPLTGMHIGEPIKFTRQGENTTTTSGNVLKSEFSLKEFKNFFEKHSNETDIVITENGIPVRPAEVSDFIKGILSENLNICSKEAQKQIVKPLDINEFIKM